MVSLMQRVLCCFAGIVISAQCCFIWGTDSGYCEPLAMDPLWKADNLLFCQRAVAYPACLPKPQKMPASREFPEGRWSNHTIINKDAWVMDSANLHIIERISLENNRTLRRANKNEFGDVGKIRKRFRKNPDCKDAYINLFCWLNFPRCDVERDLTLPTCRSACENFFKSCGYERGLWRCGKSMYFNGYEPESPKVDPISGAVSYRREYFPGQPFRENKYTTGGSEIPICTPAITGAANSWRSASLMWSSLSILGLVLYNVLLL